MQALDSYTQIMMESNLRKQAVDKVISDIKQSKIRKFSDATLGQIRDILLRYEVEEGVVVFFSSDTPAGKTMIAKIDTGKEYAMLWWGNNLNKKRVSNPCKYGLGIVMVGKHGNEKCRYTVTEISEEFPDFAEFFYKLKNGETFKLYVYQKAGDLYRAVASHEGEWILQTPQGKSFVPTKPIGKYVEGKELHIFYPKNTVKGTKYQKFILID